MALTKSTDRMTTGGVFNILDYGAVGDGSTDDTAAFAAIITAIGFIERRIDRKII